MGRGVSEAASTSSQDFVVTALEPPEPPSGDAQGLRAALQRETARRTQLEAEVRELRFLFDNAADGIARLDVAGKCLDVNSSFAAIFGRSPNELGGIYADALIATEHHGAWREAIAEMRRKGRAEATLRGQRRDDRPLVCQMVLVAAFDAHGGLMGSTLFARDVTERKKTEDALLEANGKLTSWVADLERRNHEIVLLNEMSDLLQSCVMADEVYAVVSQVARQLFPRQSGALFVGGLRSTMECVTRWGNHAPQDRSMAPEDCWALRRGRVHVQGDAEHMLRCRHGELDGEPALLSLCVPMLAQGEPLGVLQLVGVARDTSLDAARILAVTVAEHLSLGLANFKLREKLRAQSVRDPLTGLYNRRYLDECLEREVRRAARKHRSLGLILCDIDHFKQVNDRSGHEAGDAALKQLGRFLEAHVRGEDFICRYGGEEFILILPEASLRDTEQRAEAIRMGVREMRVDYPTELPIRLTMSFGVAEAPSLGTTPAQILRSADQALYEAKLAGRDRVVIGQPQSED